MRRRDAVALIALSPFSQRVLSQGVARLAALAAASIATVPLAACGGSASDAVKPAHPEDDAFAVSRRLEVAELFPRDLDTLVRVDVARMRSTLGPAAMASAAKQLGADPVLSEALARARIVTVGLRIRDLARGDRVVGIEGEMRAIVPDEALFRTLPSANERVEIFERSGDGLADETGLVLVLDERAAVFASMTEVDGVLALLRSGASPTDLEPRAEGILSIAHRSRDPSAAIAKKFPSIARVLSHIREVHAQVDVVDDGALLRAEIAADDEAGAERIDRFLATLKGGALGPKAATVLDKLAFERNGPALTLTFRVPAAVLLSWVSGDADTEGAGRDAADAPLPRAD